jgi:hypothetical protein
VSDSAAVQVAKLLGERWRNLSEAERAAYQSMAQDEATQPLSK